MIRFVPFVFLTVAFSSSWAQTSNEVYLACEKKNAEPQALQRCVAEAIESSPELKKSFEDTLSRLDSLLVERKRGQAAGCRMPLLKFEKKGNNLRLSECNISGECHVFTQKAGLVVSDKQHNQILRETAIIHSGNVLGVDVQHTTSMTNGVQQSCANPEGACYKLFTNFLGFTPVVDSSVGTLGTEVEKLNGVPEGLEESEAPFFHIQRKVEFEAPAAVFFERLPFLFSGRGTSLVAGVIDRNYSEEKMRSLLFNVNLLSHLMRRLSAFTRSRDKEMLFSFLSWGSEDFCADEVRQSNRLRRGMSLAEAFVLRKKDTSGDLAHTVGGALKTVGNGFSGVVENFSESAVRRRRTR